MSQNWRNKDKKRGNKYYNYNPKRSKFGNPLGAGVKGFMLTCNAKEVECVREGYNILDEYYEKLYAKHDEVVNSDDIDKQLEDEINQMKKNPKRFKQLSTNCRNVVFIQAPEDVDPLTITESLINDIRTEKSQKTRHLLRFVPVIQTCKSSVESIEATMRELLATRNEQFLEYMIVCKVRNNDDASSLHLIEVIANIVRQEKPQWKVKFDNPALTINADVICKVCCLSFLSDFVKNKKYNLYELSQSVINEKEENTAEVKQETEVESVENKQLSPNTELNPNIEAKAKVGQETMSEEKLIEIKTEDNSEALK